MKKLLLSLASAGLVVSSAVAPALANDSDDSVGLRGRAEIRANVKAKMETADATCVAPKVAVREQAAIDAYAKFNTSMVAALSARKTTLASAWAMTDVSARSTAIRTAWQTFAKSKKDAQKQYKTDRRAAWSAFRTSVKTCEGATTVDAGAESADNL